MSKKISFRVGITQVFTLFTLLVAGSITYNFHQRVSDVVLELSEQITTGSSQRIIDNTRDFLGVPASYTTALATNLQNAGVQDGLVEHHKELWQMMWGPLLITPQLQGIFYADEAGSHVQVWRDPGFSTRVIDRSSGIDGPADEYRVYRDEEFLRVAERHEENDYDPRRRAWYSGVVPKEGLTWSGPFISATFKTPLVAASSPILDTRGRVRGVASVNIPSYSISQLLADMPLPPGSVMLAVDEGYQLLAHTRKAWLLGRDTEGNPRVNRLEELGSPYDALRTLLEQGDPAGRTLELDAGGGGYRVLVEGFPASFERPGWRLVALLPRPAPAATEARFRDYAEQVFELLERPAAEAHQLALGFPREDAPLRLAGLHEGLWRKLWPPLMEIPQLQSFVIGDADGSFVQARREPYLGTSLIDRTTQAAPTMERRIYRDEEYQILSDKGTETDYDPRSHPWYIAAARGNRVHWSESYLSPAASIPLVSVAQAVMRDDGSKAGVVSASIPLYKISDFVAQARVSEHGRTMIVDGQGTVIAYPDKTQLLFNGSDGDLRLRQVAELEDPPMRELHDQLRRAPGLQRLVFTLGEERFIGLAHHFPRDLGQRDWTILSVVPEADILGRVNRMLMESAILTAAITLVAVLSVFFIATTVSRPIILLAKSIEGLKEFRLETIEGVYSRFTEVDRISQSILSARDGLRSFEKYVPADLVRQLITTHQQADLGGKEADLTIMFTDIEGFTGIAENLPADALMQHLSAYLDELSRIILEECGTIDKYIGDAIMAFWGAPVRHDHLPHRACRAALRCREREEQLNIAWGAAGKPLMHTRFGIHSGPTIVGNLGSRDRLNYTVIGDNVNLTSRLEGVNKYYGTSIIVSEDTYRQVREQFHFRLLDRVAVKGKKKGINIYELLGTADTPLAPQIARFRYHYHRGLKAYWSRDWDRAVALFRAISRHHPDDASVRLLLKRSLHHQKNPEMVDTNWERTYVFESK